LFFKKLVEKPILLDVHEHRARISTSGGKRIQWSPPLQRHKTLIY